MARYKVGDEVTYAGNQEVYTVVDYQQLPNCRNPKLTYYVLEDIKGNKHDCNQPHILRIHRRRFAEI
jgi:hypothetical protein